jgi:FKBP-type peptidyl-prolyl cis-trans isomerase FkpA
MRVLLLLLVIVIACSKGDDSGQAEQAQLEKDVQIIEAYLTSRGLTASATASGLHYIIDEPGEGEHPTLASRVTVHYRGYLTNNILFDESKGAPITFPLAGVIKGWQEGIPLFKKGGKGMLLLPSKLGYGASPPPGSKIPAHAVLIFEVELVDFE